MTKLVCLACPRPRSAGQYLCRTCWGRLPAATRSRLNRRDSQAFARLREMHAQLVGHVPLAEIEVTP